MNDFFRNWKNWVVFTLSCFALILAWFGWLEYLTITDDIPNNTLSGSFTEASCVDPDGVCENSAAPFVSGGVFVFLAAVWVVLTWLIYHWYLEPFVKDKRDAEGRYVRK